VDDPAEHREARAVIQDRGRRLAPEQPLDRADQQRQRAEGAEQHRQAEAGPVAAAAQVADQGPDEGEQGQP
jgi:hypothetical protein